MSQNGSNPLKPESVAEKPLKMSQNGSNLLKPELVAEKPLKMSQNGSKLIGSGSIALYDDQGFMAGLGRKLIKHIQTGQKTVHTSKKQVAKKHWTAQNGWKMEVALVEVAAEVRVLMALDQIFRVAIEDPEA